MTTLVMQRVGGKATRILTFSGEGRWVVTDGATELATVRSRTTSHRLDIEIDGRRLTAEMPGMYKSGPENEFTVTDDATGERVVEGKRIQTDNVRSPARERWAVTLANGSELAWSYQTDPPQVGFYDSADNPVMVLGHHIPFNPAPKGGTLRLLLQFWGSAIESTEQYAAEFDERTIESAVPAADVPLLAVLGMWLERRWDVKGRGSDIGFAG